MDSDTRHARFFHQSKKCVYKTSKMVKKRLFEWKRGFSWKGTFLFGHFKTLQWGIKKLCLKFSFFLFSFYERQKMQLKHESDCQQVITLVLVFFKCRGSAMWKKHKMRAQNESKIFYRISSYSFLRGNYLFFFEFGKLKFTVH